MNIGKRVYQMCAVPKKKWFLLFFIKKLIRGNHCARAHTPMLSAIIKVSHKTDEPSHVALSSNAALLSNATLLFA